MKHHRQMFFSRMPLCYKSGKVILMLFAYIFHISERFIEGFTVAGC